MLHSVIKSVSATHGGNVAYVSRYGKEITYKELDVISDEMAVWLTNEGISEGSVVGLSLPSCIEYIVSYLALAKIGAITAGINPRFTSLERSKTLGTLDPNLVITTQGHDDGVGDQYQKITIGLNEAELIQNYRVAGGSPQLLEEDDERPVCICFTSGSSGSPKGALFANRQLRAISELDAGGAWGGGGHRYASTEFAHVGVMTKLPWLLATAGTTHLIHKWNAREILQLIHEYKMSSVSAIAPQVALMLKQDGIEQLDFSSVKAIVTGGAYASVNLIKKGREIFGAPWSVRYSSTESGGIGLGTSLTADDYEALHTIGRPREGVKAKICDSSGSELPTGEVGEIWISSPAVMSCYWNDPEETAKVFDQEWLKTGDLAYQTPEGYFILAGRTTEMYIRGGYNVYPLEVEGIFSEHPSVAEVVIIPCPDDIMGEIGVAVIVLEDGCLPTTIDDLRSFGAEKLAAYKLPEKVIHVESIPRNTTDKIDRRELKEIVKRKSC
tara:strand:+ start:243 stop:1736 length:1494 start_codon:yes stop_codon:yes gene_type:complete